MLHVFTHKMFNVFVSFLLKKLFQVYFHDKLKLSELQNECDPVLLQCDGLIVNISGRRSLLSISSFSSRDVCV